MATLSSLDCLARFAPQIFGRALSYEEVYGQVRRQSGRSDWVDASTVEMRSALSALSLLSKLSRRDEAGEVMSRILVYTHVLRGPEARQRPEMWLDFYEAFIGIVKKKASPERQAVYLGASMALYGFARARWLKLSDVPQA